MSINDIYIFLANTQIYDILLLHKNSVRAHILIFNMGSFYCNKQYINSKSLHCFFFFWPKSNHPCAIQSYRRQGNLFFPSSVKWHRFLAQYEWVIQAQCSPSPKWRLRDRATNLGDSSVTVSCSWLCTEELLHQRNLVGRCK